MKVKKLIEILKQAPQNIDVDIFDYSTEYLLSIDDIWIPKKEDMEDNPEVQIQNKDFPLIFPRTRFDDKHEPSGA